MCMFEHVGWINPNQQLAAIHSRTWLNYWGKINIICFNFHVHNVMNVNWTIKIKPLIMNNAIVLKSNYIEVSRVIVAWTNNWGGRERLSGKERPLEWNSHAYKSHVGSKCKRFYFTAKQFKLTSKYLSFHIFLLFVFDWVAFQFRQLLYYIQHIYWHFNRILQ